MRRRLGILALVAVAAAAVLAGTAQGTSDYRFAAVFDSAQGIVPGQLVKIAGARVGSVKAVELIPGAAYHARLILEIDGKYGPFHADASCQLLPEGVISEKFVDCDPGSESEPTLAPGKAGYAELTDTAAPLTLQDVLNVFSVPTGQRLRILFNELGIATVGRGQDINQLLRRSNPALKQANRVLSIIGGQREQIDSAIGQTNRVLARLAADDQAVADFVDKGSAVARATASKHTELAAGIRDLPGLLEAAHGGLHSLNTAMDAGTPLLADVRRAGSDLDRFTRRTRDFSRKGLPAVKQLGDAAKTGVPAIPPIAGVVGDLTDLGKAAPEPLADLGDALVSVRDTNGWEGLLKTAYGLAVGAAARDNKSHYYGAVINVFPICILVPPEVVIVPGCVHRYNSPESGRIPINDPAQRSVQKAAFLKWLRVGGPQKTPEILRSSLMPLVQNVADSLHMTLSREQLRPVTKVVARKPAAGQSEDKGAHSKPAKPAGRKPPTASKEAAGPPADDSPDGLGPRIRGLLDFLLK